MIITRSIPTGESTLPIYRLLTENNITSYSEVIYDVYGGHYSVKLLDDLLDKHGYIILKKESTIFSNTNKIEIQYILKRKVSFIFIVLNIYTDELYVDSITYQNTDEKYVADELIPLIATKFVKKKNKSSTLYLLDYNNNEYKLIENKIKPVRNLDIGLHYGEDFVEFDKYVRSKLKKGNKGLILFDGLHGTGKSYYIRYLASKITNKRFIFIPPHLISFFSDPGFIGFAAEELKNTIIIIEDGEETIVQREDNSRNAAITNILNIGDGLLSDILQIQIIITCNTNRDNIDTAILRDGRMIAEYNFQKLSIEQSQKLLNKLKIDYVTDKEMYLGEIYGLLDGKDRYKQKSSEKKQIGFT